MPTGTVLRGDFVFAIMLVMRRGRRILLDRANATPIGRPKSRREFSHHWIVVVIAIFIATAIQRNSF
jgi:hypothetical protein